MSRRFRHILSLLLAFALPLQGGAAWAMAGCGTAPAVAAHHGPAMAADPAHAAMARIADHAVATHDDKAKCSACVACFAAAMPSATATFDGADAMFAFARTVPSTPTEFVTGRLERPPRRFHA